MDEMLGSLRFGVEAPSFFNTLGAALGFKAERPEKEWKEGPDNLWALRGSEYLLVECKSKVELTRDQINKTETGQMNNATAWFKRTYQGATAKNIMIIPTKRTTSFVHQGPASHHCGRRTVICARTKVFAHRPAVRSLDVSNCPRRDDSGRFHPRALTHVRSAKCVETGSA